MQTPTDAAFAEGAPNQAANSAVKALALTMFLMPAIGMPSELMLQDTLKSALVVFGVLAAALLFLWQQRQHPAPLRWHGLAMLPLVLMAYALASMAWSHTYLAGVEAVRWFVLSLLLWLGLNTVTRENLPTLLWGIHGGAVVASLWAALQFWFDFSLFPQGPSPASTFINRNFFAEYAVCVLPLSVWLLADLRNPHWRPWVALSLALNLVTLMMTGTRSALAAMLVLAPVLALLVWRYRRQLAWAGWSQRSRVLVGITLTAGVLALGALPSGNPAVVRENIGSTALQRSIVRATSMTDVREYTERSFSIRATMWKATARMMLANGWSGVGAGAWEVQIPLYQNASTILETDYYAHNEVLQLLSEYGLVAGGLALAFLLAYWLQSADITRRLTGGNLAEAPPRAFTLTSLLALLIVCNAGFPLHLAGCGALLALCLGILAGSDTRLKDGAGKFSKPLLQFENAGDRHASGRAPCHSWGHLGWNRCRTRYFAITLLSCCMALAVFITLLANRAEQKLVHAIQLANSLRQPQQPGAPSFAVRKASMLQDVRDGIAINPHYRKLTAEVAELLAAGDDWANALWMLESIAASRPHLVAIWTGLAMGHARLEQHDQAQQAYRQVHRLKPDAISTKTLQIVLLGRAGQDDQATRLLSNCFDRDVFDFDMVQAGYALGYKTGNWPLAIRSLELRNKTWPDQAADGYLRLGKLYAQAQGHDDARALAAFRAGLSVVPQQQKDNFRHQVPLPYREQM